MDLMHPKLSLIGSHTVLRASTAASSILSNDSRATSASYSCLVWPHCFDGCSAILLISADLAMIRLVPSAPLYYALFHFDVHPFLRNRFCFHFPSASASI